MASRLRIYQNGAIRGNPYQKQQNQGGAFGLGWLADLQGAGSNSVDLRGSAQNSYGSYGGGGASPGSCFSLDICPDLILAALAVAAAAAVFLINQQIVAVGRSWGGTFLQKIGANLWRLPILYQIGWTFYHLLSCT